MADERPLGDEFEEREQEFALQQGISELDYAELLDLVAAHAAVTPSLPGAASWRFVGPRNLGGRVIGLDQDPSDPRILYAGAAHGGLWRTVDAGDTWERLGEAEHIFPVGTIGVAPTATNVLYFGTGALHPWYVSGRGLYRATISGSTGAATIERLVAADSPTVAPPNATPGAALRYTRLRADPDDPTRFWVASQTGLWRCECPLAQPATPRFTRDFPNHDNEPSVAALTSSVDAQGFWPSHSTDLLLAHDPRETDTVPLNGRDVPRYLILFLAVDSVGIFRGRFDRKDSTVSFEESPRSLPLGGLTFSRIRLSQCERQPQHVYAIMAAGNNTASEVFHSSDNGDNWTKGAQTIGAVGALAGQADYDLFVEVAPDDPRIVVAGAGDVCLSSDFGSNWTKILDWQMYDAGDKAQHADQHIAMFDKGDHRRLWIGNDGGLTQARDLRMPVQAPGYWRKRSHGIYAGMAQDVSINPALPFMCIAGFQDNGSFMSLGGPTWFHVGGADGGAAAFNLPNPRQFIVTWQGEKGTKRRGIEQVDAVPSDLPISASPGAFHDLVTIAASDIPEPLARGHRVCYRWTTLSLPAQGIVTRSPFVGVIEQDSVTAGNLLAGRDNDAYFSTTFGTAWTPLLGAGTQVAPAAGDGVCALTFGPPDPKNPAGPAVVDGWAGTVGGRLFFTNNAPTAGWAAAATQLPFPGPGLRISEIFVHPLDRRIVAVSATGLHSRVFISYTRGRTWIDISEPVPTALVVAPAGASLGRTQTRAFTAIANYGATVVNVTWRANWSSNTPAQATVVTPIGGFISFQGFGTEGRVTGVAAGTPTITATLLANVPNGSASQAVTITAAAQPATPLATQPRDMVPGSLPPGPVSSVIFDPAIAAMSAATLFAGTLAGVYALTGVPVVQSLAIQPGGPLTFQTGAAAFQLRCDATFTDGTSVVATQDVDWSTDTPGTATVSNAAGTEGQVTIVGVGTAKITADRGGATVTINITVQAAAAPAPPAPTPAPVALNPTVSVNWQRFNAGLPQVLVTDFERVAGSNAIRAATFGLGVFECITTGAPQQQLYIRQTLVEDGRTYPRALPPGVPDDPRLVAGAVALDMTHAYDIRVDAPPFSFFDDVVDGAELDELLEVDDPVPTEDNYVYVQVLNAGTIDVPNVSVHLYAAECGAADVINPIGPAATASPASLDGAGALIADFYGQANRDPIPASKWKRVDTVRLLETVASDAPRVARFTWRPDVALQTKNVALLALCEGPPTSADPLPAAPAAATLSAFILAERRAALRVVRVAARPAASVYVRDGVADDTRIGGYPVGGRSPDIMVVHPDITGTPADAFKDFVSRRPTDTVSGTGTNIIYVRVHNRRRFETKAKVKVFAIDLNDSNTPRSDPSFWTELPAGASFADVTIPPSGVGYARVEFPNATDPNVLGTSKNYLLLAVVKSEDETDPLPNRDRVDSVDAFWDLVSRYVDSDNAAARVVAWTP
jgi:uncharacterized protein YjdB